MLAAVAGAVAAVRAGDMGSMPGMDANGMGQTNNSMQSTNSDESSATTYAVRGVVEKIAPDFHQATIHNEAIPGYMDEMTMDFNVRNTNELSGISPGDQITFKLIVGKNDEWIEDVKRTGQTMPASTNAMPSMQMPPAGK